MNFTRREELLNDSQGLFELLAKLVVFLIAPGIAERHELPVQHGHAMVQFAVELLQVLRETPKFGWIDNRLRHWEPRRADEQTAGQPEQADRQEGVSTDSRFTPILSGRSRDRKSPQREHGCPIPCLRGGLLTIPITCSCLSPYPPWWAPSSCSYPAGPGLPCDRRTGPSIAGQAPALSRPHPPYLCRSIRGRGNKRYRPRFGRTTIAARLGGTEGLHRFAECETGSSPKSPSLP